MQSKRVNGEPRIVWQKYLGSVEVIIKRCEQNLAPLSAETVLFEVDGVAALLGIVEKLELEEFIMSLKDPR